MVRLLFLLIVATGATPTMAQSKYLTKTSEVTFFSSAPLEDITAINNDMAGVVDFESGEFLMRIPIIKFDFPIDLMEEHFNENYMETELYPFAIYKGTFDDTVDPTQPGEYTLKCSGILDIHGVQQSRDIEVALTVDQKALSAAAAFTIHLEDHAIEIPKIVFKKIAEVIDVKMSATFEPLKK